MSFGRCWRGSSRAKCPPTMRFGRRSPSRRGACGSTETGGPKPSELDDGTTLVIAESASDEGREVDGWFLVRDVAPRVGGIVFDPSEPWVAVFRPEQLPVMRAHARPHRWTNKFGERCAVLEERSSVQEVRTPPIALRPGHGEGGGRGCYPKSSSGSSTVTGSAVPKLAR